MESCVRPVRDHGPVRLCLVVRFILVKNNIVEC